MSALMTEQLDGIMTVFEQLSADLLSFSELFLQEKPRFFAEHPENDLMIDHQQLLHQLIDIWHKDGQDGRTTARVYGLISVSPSLFEAAQALNASKALFKQQISLINKEHTATITSRLKQRSEQVGRVLNLSGLGRLHLKQCYRLLPILDSQPDSVKFSWYSSGRSIRKLTVQDAIDRLLKMDTSQPHIQIQLEKCMRLSAHTELAQVQSQVPVVRANFVWKHQGESPVRKARNCPLPILFAQDNSKSFPTFNTLPTQKPERIRAERSDSAIDPTPFLPSLRVHLYRP
jgi:hypothetical protein